MNEQPTPIEELEAIIAENEARDPNFYADPNKPTETLLRAALTINEVRAQGSRSSNSKSYANEAGWRPFGFYGPNNSPVPIGSDPMREERR